jgi:hypothetical protein
MTGWYSLWSFGIFFPLWYVWTKKNLATLDLTGQSKALKAEKVRPKEGMVGVSFGMS